MGCQVVEEPPRTLVDKDSAASKEDNSAGREQKTGSEEDYAQHVINPDRTRLHEFFGRMTGVAPWVKDCEEWSTDDSRVGMLTQGAHRLFIGKPNADGDGVDDLEKNYEVLSVGIGGSPFEGAVYVMLQVADMRTEKAVVVGSPPRATILFARYCACICSSATSPRKNCASCSL